MTTELDIAKPAYDGVAALYDRAFADIRVRRAEWRWVTEHLNALDTAPRVLEIGCGTGALLRALSPRISAGIGVDVSGAMIARAEAALAPRSNLSFHTVSSAALPFESGHFDLVISFLSFRYLDWPRVMPEIRRVLSRGGRFWMIDMCAKRAAPSDAPRLARAALRQLVAPVRTPRFARDLKALTSHPEWHQMLTQHPIRRFEEYQEFFGYTFPERPIEVLDVAARSRVVAFDSGPLP